MKFDTNVKAVFIYDYKELSFGVIAEKYLNDDFRLFNSLDELKIANKDFKEFYIWQLTIKDITGELLGIFKLGCYTTSLQLVKLPF